MKARLAFILVALGLVSCGKGLDTASDPSQRQFLYVASTNTGYENILTFSIDSMSGNLTWVATNAAPTGSVPGPIAVDSANTYLGVGYMGSTPGVAAWQIDQGTGVATALSFLGTGANKPQAIAALPGSPGYFFTANAVPTTMANVSGYSVTSGTISSTGGSTPVAGTAAALAIAPDGSHLFASALSTNTQAYSINASKSVSATTVSSSSVTSCLAIHPGGTRLYGGSGGGPQVLEFSVTPSTGALAPITSTTISGNVIAAKVTPQGDFLVTASLESGNTLRVFRLNSSTGVMTTTSTPTSFGGSGVKQLVFDRTGSYLYADDSAGLIYGFFLDHQAGTVSPLSGSPYSNGGISLPLGLAVSSLTTL